MKEIYKSSVPGKKREYTRFTKEFLNNIKLIVKITDSGCKGLYGSTPVSKMETLLSNLKSAEASVTLCKSAIFEYQEFLRKELGKC